MKNLYTFLLLLLSFFPCFSQQTEKISQDIDFAFYLLDRKNFDEVVLLLNQTTLNIEQAKPISDSVNYVLGMTYYHKKELEKSALHLSKVSITSTFHTKATFFSALDYAHLGHYQKAQTILEAYNALDSNYNELVALELAGLALLNRNLESFDQHAKDFRFEQYYYTNSENKLMDVKKTLSNYKPKSPFVAGMLSAILPGTGKIYAGQVGDGVATLLTVGGLAAITAENWVKDGFFDWKTITFGALFSVFYIGNIYGSVATVKIYRSQFNEKQNNTILLSIHLPIRALFE